MKKLSFKCISLILTFVFVISCGTCTLSFADNGEYILGGQYKVVNELIDDDCSKDGHVGNFTGADLEYGSDATDEWVTVLRSATKDNRTYEIEITKEQIAEAFEKQNDGLLCFSEVVRLYSVRSNASQGLINISLGEDEKNKVSYGAVLCSQPDVGNSHGRLVPIIGQQYNYQDMNICGIRADEWYRVSWIFRVADGVPDKMQMFVEALGDTADALHTATITDTNGPSGKMFSTGWLDANEFITKEGAEVVVGEAAVIRRLYLRFANGNEASGVTDGSDSTVRNTTGAKLISISNMNLSFVEPVSAGVYDSFAIKKNYQNLSVDNKAKLDDNISQSYYNSSKIVGSVKGSANDTAVVYVAVINSTTNELLSIYPKELNLDSNGYGVYNIEIKDKTMLQDLAGNANYRIKVYNWNKGTLVPYSPESSVLN